MTGRPARPQEELGSFRGLRHRIFLREFLVLTLPVSEPLRLVGRQFLKDLRHWPLSEAAELERFSPLLRLPK